MGAGTSSGKGKATPMASTLATNTANTTTKTGGTLAQRISSAPFKKNGNTSTLRITDSGPYGDYVGTAEITKTPSGYHIEVSVNDGMPTTRIDLREYQMSESQRETYARNILKNRMA